jgi:hypothetical protein
MREAVAYGLERFWGEHLRFSSKKKKDDESKGLYWKDTWEVIVKLMNEAGISIPNDKVKADDDKAVKKMAEKLWELDLEDQRVTLGVLTQLCDSMVWWTQRYKS